VDTVELNPKNLNPLIPRARVSLSHPVSSRAPTLSPLSPAPGRAAAAPPPGARAAVSRLRHHASGPRRRPGSPTLRSYSSSTHPSSRSRLDFGSFWRQESRRPPVAPRAPDKNRYASDSRREGITPRVEAVKPRRWDGRWFMHVAVLVESPSIVVRRKNRKPLFSWAR
jgi:hypothetical protein